MRAVEHEVGGRSVGLRIDPLDRLTERHVARQAPVCLDRERDHDGQLGSPGGPDDPDRLFRVGKRQRRDHVRGRRVERRDLGQVISLCLVWRHEVTRPVRVASRADTAADHDRRALRLVVGTDLLEQCHSLSVHVCELVGRVPELCAPVRACTPCRGVEDEADVSLARELRIGLEVRPQLAHALVVRQQREARKAGEVEPAVEHQHRLHPAVGHARRARGGRKRLAVAHRRSV